MSQITYGSVGALPGNRRGHPGVLGVYIPEAVREGRMYERAKAAMSPEFLEDIERRSQEPGICYTTAEVMQKLRELEAKHST